MNLRSRLSLASSGLVLLGLTVGPSALASDHPTHPATTEAPPASEHAATDAHLLEPPVDHHFPAVASPEKPDQPSPGGGHEGTPNPIQPPPEEPPHEGPHEGMSSHATTVATHAPEQPAHSEALAEPASPHDSHGAESHVAETPVAESHGTDAHSSEHGATATAASDHGEHDAHGSGHQETVIPANPAERKAMAESLFRIAERKHENRLYEDARLSLQALLELHPGEVLEVQALRLLSETYRMDSEYPRAVAILERVVKDYPGDDSTPENLLVLGRLYREMGVTDLAMARFYSVLNSTLKLSEDNLDHYQLVARTAQFEIAETHLATGHYEEASEFFRRLSLLDLAPEDRARAQFKAASSLFLAEDWRGAGIALQRFLQNTPNNDDFPEAFYLLSFCYQNTGRHEESLRVALKLFDETLAAQATSPLNWRYWQRRVGNQLANDFFRKGQLNYALKLYDQLASITPEPLWRAPALYQVAVTAERLGLYPRADEAYGEVVTLAESFPELSEIGEMAAWRRENMTWALDFERNRLAVLGATVRASEDSFAASEEGRPKEKDTVPES